MIRVTLPFHLRTLARLPDGEVKLEIGAAGDRESADSSGQSSVSAGPPSNAQPTLRSVLDALEARYPMLRGTIRDHVTLQRRPFLRFFACGRDLSHDSHDAPLPEAVADGKEPLMVVGAIAGG